LEKLINTLEEELRRKLSMQVSNYLVVSMLIGLCLCWYGDVSKSSAIKTCLDGKPIYAHGRWRWYIAVGWAMFLTSIYFILRLS
jgi:hypothetical protein